MTDLALVIARGSGQLEYRLVIAGAQHVWCTNRAMAGTQADGRLRVHGLQRQGLRISESVSMLEGRLEQEAFSARIVDIGGRATAAFMSEPSVVAYMRTSVSASATAWDVSDSTGLNGLRLHVGQEVVLVTAAPTSTTITVTRAQWDTVATAHYVQTGETTIYPVLRDVPPHMMNRRAELYAHGVNELGVASAGVRVWRGLVGGGARLIDSAAAYEIPLAPLSKVLEQNIGPKSKEPLRFRGIYYAAVGALWFVLNEHSGANFASSTSYSCTVQLAGYYSTQGEFRAALQTAIDAALPVGWTTTVTVVDDGSGWTIEITTSAVAARYVSIYGGSAVDGHWGGGTGTGALQDSATGARVLDVTTATTYRVAHQDTPIIYRSGVAWVYVPDERAIGWPDGASCVPRTVPRACYTTTGPLDIPWASAAANPVGRLYLEDVSGITVDDAFIADPVPFSGSQLVGAVLAVNSTAGYVDLDSFDLNQVGFDGQWKITQMKRYGLTPGTLTDFRDALVAASVDAVPGQGPRVFSSDLGDWAEAAAIAGGHPFLDRRDYVFMTPTRLGDLLEHECRLYGLVPYIDAEQKIQLRRLAPVLSTDVPDLTMTTANRGVTSGFGQLEDAPDGIITTAEVFTRWDPIEGKHAGPSFAVQNVGAISDAGSERILEIKPLVRAENEPTSIAEVIDVAFGRTALYGDRYRTITMTATFACLDAVLGDVVRVDIPQLPMNGTRGFLRNGRLISRDWDLDSGRGSLKVVFFALGPAGYAPSALVDTATLVSGNTWDIAITTAEYFAAGSAVADFFEAGSLVTMTQRRTATPTNLTGTVVSVTGSTIRVTFTGAFTSRANDVLVFQARSVVTAAQRAWAFIASSTTRFASPSAIGQTFSP